MADEVPLPDPDRVGGPGWLDRTGGVLTPADRRRMILLSLRAQRDYLRQRLSARRPVTVDLAPALEAPDGRLAREAESAALDQAPVLLAHAYRTAVFARALAVVDGVAVDDELLYVCALLHDLGLVRAVTGEDFTRRGADAAAACARRCDRPGDAARLYDAVVVHATVGVTPEADGALGAYTQYGAIVDLTGLRERHLPRGLVGAAVRRHPRTGFVTELRRAIHEEARAVPGGRFALLPWIGVTAALHVASVPSRP